MLSVQRLDLTLSEEDLNRLADEVLDFKDIDDLRLGLKEGVMHAALKIAKLGFTVPVEAELRLREIGTGTLRLEVDITAPALLPAAMKDIALKKVLDSLPVPGVSYHQGEVRVDLDELLGGAPVQFDLAGVEIRAGWLSLSLANLRYLPVVSTGEAATGEQVPKPVAVTGPDRALVAVPEHQDFYDRLKAQVSEQARRRLPSRLQPLVPWLLLVPDSFALLVRLMRDPRVPRRSKWITALAVAYFVDPLDLIPDAVPVLGQMDDLAVALFALDALLGDTPADVAQELWPGRGDIIATVREGVRFFSRYLSGGALAKIKALLSRTTPDEQPPDRPAAVPEQRTRDRGDSDPS